MADAVGGQTRVVLIRGLSVGVGIRGVARTELITGAIMGAVVGLALFASCAILTVVAMALPWAFQRFGADPAFGPAPWRRWSRIFSRSPSTRQSRCRSRPDPARVRRRAGG
jgi:Mg/Co/Ni transporter MgtE